MQEKSRALAAATVNALLAVALVGCGPLAAAALAYDATHSILVAGLAGWAASGACVVLTMMVGRRLRRAIVRPTGGLAGEGSAATAQPV